MTNHANARMTIREERIEQEVTDYKVAMTDVLKGHPGEAYLFVGFKEGMKQGMAVGSAAVASGVNRVIGQIDAGLLVDLDAVQDSLTRLVNVAQQEIGR